MRVRGPLEPDFLALGVPTFGWAEGAGATAGLSPPFAGWAAGVGLVTWTIVSAIRTVILPRSAQSLITNKHR